MLSKVSARPLRKERLLGAFSDDINNEGSLERKIAIERALDWLIGTLTRNGRLTGP